MLAYRIEHGLVPDGHDVDHTCHNPDVMCPGGPACLHRRCCNGRHLVARLPADNQEAANALRQRAQFAVSCPEGHPLDGRTWRAPRRGREGFWERYCRTCARWRVWERKHPGERHPERLAVLLG